MKVTADQVAALRKLLIGDSDGFKRMSSQLDPATKAGMGSLIAAAFFKAGERRFKGGTDSDVVAFVGNLRAQYNLTQEVDPRVAERLLLATFTDEEINDIDGETQGDHFGLLLAKLIADEKLSDSDLDGFLADARRLADSWLS